MRFLGRLAIILTVALGAAVVHSMQWPITRDAADAMQRRDRVPPAEPTSKPDSQSGQAAKPDSDAKPEETLPDEPELGVDPTVEDPIPVPDEGQPQEELPDYYISVEQAYEYWEQAMPFIDARTDAERTVGTVEGALHLETRDFITGMSAQVLNQIDRAFPVIIFCGGGECDASENVAQRLIGRGYTEVYIMHEGFGAWEAAGHPTEPVGGG